MPRKKTTPARITDARDISHAFGKELPNWYLGVSQDGGRFVIYVAHGYQTHPTLRRIVEELRGRLGKGQTLHVQQRAMARAR